MRRPLLTAAALTAVLLPSAPSAAQEQCDYALQLNRVQIASVQPPPPAGYEYAQVPSNGQEPGQSTPFHGTVEVRGGCSPTGLTVVLQSRDAGQPQAFATRRSTTTDVHGEYRFDARPTRSAVVRALLRTPEGRSVTSAELVVEVRTAVSATYTRAAGCVLLASGSTYPAKPGHPVQLQAVAGGRYTTVARGTSDAGGRYQVRWRAGCGAHDLAVLVPASASNTAGRTLYVRLGVVARP